VVRLEEVRLGGHGPWSLAVGEGERVAVAAGSSWARQALLALLTGRQRPASGRVLLLGRDLYDLTAEQGFALFREVGVVREGGGLVSNLRAWENLLLPVAYHAGRSAAEIRPRVVDYFESLGLRGDDLASCLDGLPGLLPEHWRRVVGLVRALLMEPRLMVYESLLEGLPASLTPAVAALAVSFHERRSGRTSVFVVTETGVASALAVSRTIALQGD
jgi:phospholipid/cholesterol/gamma-HCH transport system ATP-binding protein